MRFFVNLVPIDGYTSSFNKSVLFLTFLSLSLSLSLSLFRINRFSRMPCDRPNVRPATSGLIPAYNAILVRTKIGGKGSQVH